MLTTFQKALVGTIAGGALLVALVIAAKGTAVAAIDPGVPGRMHGLVTVGDASVKVRPDLAIITVGAVAQAATAADAQGQVSERIAKVLERAKALGVAERDTKTAGYRIDPQYAHGAGQAPRLTGFQATQQITLTLRRVDDAGKALDALVQSDGATTATVSFAIDDSRPAQADARRLATLEARAKAEAMARAAGVKLGRVLSVSDVGHVGSVPQPAGAMLKQASAAAPQLPTGEFEIVVRVEVHFAIDG